ncbi:MAG: GNAT family N-acetyltransferase [Balneolaceae bacterium]|nr:GNAT family N-acetyltransferase [Balneolaceae bacterium]
MELLMSTQTIKTYSWKMEPFNINSHKYTVRLAVNRQEVEKALQLRFQVFNLELGEGLESSFKNRMDEDEYDDQCDHLLVIEKDSNAVIGTYRMQDSEMAHNGNGFYTANEFEINQLSSDILGDAVELGRACVHKDHRNGRVLYLLWRGLAHYLIHTKKRFLFGCCSLTTQDPEEGKQVYSYLQQNDYIHPSIQIDVHPKYQCLDEARGVLKPEAVELPKLFQLYLDVGTTVCSAPALDQVFKTIDFFILMDIKNLSDQTKTLFFR